MKAIRFDQLNRGDSFLQVNFFRGYKYIDKAGELLNSYVNKKNHPLREIKIGVNELIIPKPHPNIEELKISHQIFWLHFTQTNLDLLTFKRIFEDELVKISKIIDFEYITRIGWRNYFIYEFTSTKQKDAAFQKLQVIENTDTDLIKLTMKNTLIKANLLIEKVKRSDEENKLGLLFDLDAYYEGEINVKDIPQKLNNIYNYIIKNQFINIVSELNK